MIFETKPHPRTASSIEQAMRELSRADAALAALIRRVGPCELGMRRRGRYFPALVEAIIYQQLSGKAAASILARFRALYPTGGFPTPVEVAGTSAQRLRTAGLSAQKKDNVTPIFRSSSERIFRALATAAISAGFPTMTHAAGAFSTSPRPLHTEAGA